MRPRFPEQRPDREPRGEEVTVAGLVAIHEIGQRDEWHDEALVAAFLSAAWPTALAQNQ